jgi:hypothetical protein
MLPFAHAFGPSVMDPSAYYLWDGVVGEVPMLSVPTLPSATWTGSNGRSWCGLEDVWLHGEEFAAAGTRPIDAGGVPLCCNRTGVEADHNCDHDAAHDRLAECF